MLHSWPVALGEGAAGVQRLHIRRILLFFSSSGLSSILVCGAPGVCRVEKEGLKIQGR
jgi:hypothetical protein